MEIRNEKRFCGMLGFAMRAGKLTVGTELICRALAKGTPRLVVVSSCASPSTRKKLLQKSEFYGVSAIEVDIDTARLGQLLGKSYTPAAVAVTDDSFALEIKKAVESE